MSEEEGLELVRWGTHFVSEESERAYRDWHVRMSVPFNRAGLWVAVANTFIFVGVLAALGTRNSGALVIAAAVLILPAIALPLWCTYRKPAWMPALTALANCIAGTATVTYPNWLLEVGDVRLAHSAAIGATLLLVFFGFAILRVRPVQALAGVMPYVALDIVWALHHNAAGRSSLTDIVTEGFLLFVGVMSGIIVSIVLDIVSRQSFRQERIIERQKETIAIERAKSEALLQQEVRHQVAQRSRELGEILAKTDLPMAAKKLAPGDRFDARYVVVRALGEGGMGAVYEVERLTDAQRLALKIITGYVSGESAARFAREAEIGARLRHENLVAIVDVGVSGGPFLVMELVTGGSLEDHRERFGTASWALPLVRQIARGLDALHRGGVVHRDLKPGNILLSDDGRARISDFGISRLGDPDIDPNAATMPVRASPNLTGTGIVLGTPLYMAPEAAHGGKTLSPAADVFAFGIVAHEMLTGALPFKVAPVMLALAEQPIPPAASIDDANVPEKARAIVGACLDADPAKRPRIADILDAL